MKAEEFVEKFQKTNGERYFGGFLVDDTSLVVKCDDVEIIKDEVYFFNRDVCDTEDKTLVMRIDVEDFENKKVKFFARGDYFSVSIKGGNEDD